MITAQRRQMETWFIQRYLMYPGKTRETCRRSRPLSALQPGWFGGLAVAAAVAFP